MFVNDFTECGNSLRVRITHLPSKVLLIRFVHIEQQLIHTVSFKDFDSAKLFLKKKLIIVIENAKGKLILMLMLFS